MPRIAIPTIPVTPAITRPLITPPDEESLCEHRCDRVSVEPCGSFLQTQPLENGTMSESCISSAQAGRSCGKIRYERDHGRYPRQTLI
jgi:hypothetical protein